MKKVATCFNKVYGHPRTAHAHKSKIAIANLQEIVEINKFQFSPKLYQIQPWMVLQLITMGT
jgi:hypothetical protein